MLSSLHLCHFSVHFSLQTYHYDRKFEYWWAFMSFKPAKIDFRYVGTLSTFWQTLKIPALVQQKAESLTLKRYDNLTTINKSYWWLQIVQFITQMALNSRYQRPWKWFLGKVLSFQKYGRLRCLKFCQRFNDFFYLG